MKNTLNKKEMMAYSESLVRFVNVCNQTELAHFRLTDREFFPPRFLDGNVEATIPTVRNTSKSMVMPMWWGFQQGVRRAWEEGFPPDWSVILITLTTSKTSSQTWPYQSALMFLAIEPWRARFCGKCGKQFVAEKPATKFCSNRCAKDARRVTRNAWWRDHGRQWRSERGRKIHPAGKH